MPMKAIRTASAIAFVAALGLGPATAHQQGPKLHLADAPLDQQIDAIEYCQGVYRVVTKQGEPVEYPEFDLRFKTDSSENGPQPGTAVLINAGMRGDRGFVIFASPEVQTTYLKTSC
ncbi:MAG: hypothetical protein ACTSVG_11820 [Alphaproteobacteria bacterium]